MLPLVLLAVLYPALILAQSPEGSIDGPKNSAEAAGYSCDSSKCRLPDCNCASPNPPGGLSPQDTPMFVLFTADDAIQTYTLDSVNQFLAHRKNPNGCQPKMTYFTSLGYTNYSLVTDWYVAGNEIADHTMTHVGSPSQDEINGNLITLNALSGIPMSAMTGFRAPFLNYTAETLKFVAEAGFTYDSSASASIPVGDGTDAYWPYTLDNGLANDCLDIPGVCKGEPKLPGFWEIPMYAIFDNRGVAGPHLMDPWLDTVNNNKAANDSATLEMMKNTFTAHYNGNRQPFGLYTHPIHVAKTVPGATVTDSTINMINAFLDWAQEQPNVWIVTNQQLLEWVRHPVPISQLESFDALKCNSPQVSDKICNGMPENQAGLMTKCEYEEYPFYTCYGCPKELPSPSNPNPEQRVADGQQPRFRLPANCSTPFWDPIKGNCICTSSSCAFVDNSRPIGPNGANLTGGGLGGNGDGASATPTAYIPFNGSLRLEVPLGVWGTVLVGFTGALLGSLGLFARL